MPGISPTKIAFQPSRNCSWEIAIPNAGKIFDRIDGADLVPPVGEIVAQRRPDAPGLAAGVRRPARDRAIEIDVNDNSAEIEQQSVGGIHAAPPWRARELV